MSHSVTAWPILRYQSASYQYDANGNRSRALYQWPRQSGAGHNQLERQLSLPAGSNRIQSLGQSQNIEGQSSTIVRNFEWDAAGQLLSDGDKQHQYNPQGRKASTQAPEPSGTGNQTLNSHYLYNAHSQRVRKASHWATPTTATARLSWA